MKLTIFILLFFISLSYSSITDSSIEIIEPIEVSLISSKSYFTYFSYFSKSSKKFVFYDNLY